MSAADAGNRYKPPMKRRTRFLLHALLPPLFGGTLLFPVLLVGRGGELHLAETLMAFAAVLGVAYLWAILPSLVYAALMEWAFARGTIPGSRPAVALSALLGTAVGSIPLVGELFNAHRKLHLDDLLEMMIPSAVGFVVGIAVELIVAARARRNALTAPPSDP